MLKNLNNKIKGSLFLLLIIACLILSYFAYVYINIYIENQKIEEIENKITDKKIGLNQALEECLSILEKNPKNIKVISLIAKIYTWTFDDQKAAEYYKKGLVYEPENISLLSNLARLNIRSTNFSEAENLLNKIVELKKGDTEIATAYMDLGIISESKRDFYKALDMYNKSIEINPNFAEPWVQKGFTQLEITGKSLENKDLNFAASQNSANEAIKINPRLTSAYLLSMSLALFKGQTEKVLEMKNKALEVLPTDETLDVFQKGEMETKIKMLASVKVLTKEEVDKLKKKDE